MDSEYFAQFQNEKLAAKTFRIGVGLAALVGNTAFLFLSDRKFPVSFRRSSPHLSASFPSSLPRLSLPAHSQAPAICTACPLHIVQLVLSPAIQLAQNKSILMISTNHRNGLVEPLRRIEHLGSLGAPAYLSPARTTITTHKHCLVTNIHALHTK